MGRGRRPRHRWCVVCQDPFRPPRGVMQTCCSQDCVDIADATARLDETAWSEYESWFASLRNIAEGGNIVTVVSPGESTVDMVEFRVRPWAALSSK